MKLHSLLAVAMGTLLAAGCSSDEPIVNNGDNGNNGATGNAYISLSVQLPTSTSTRATDTFDDGTADEYAVKDMTVLIFDANNDFETCYTTENGSMQLPSGWDKDNDNTNNITTTATTQALKVKDGEKHVVVVLNNHGMYDFSKVTKLSDLKNLTNLKSTVTKDNKDHYIVDFTTTNSKGFFMATSPYYNGKPSDPKVVEYATVIPTTNIGNPGRAKVYVERLTAKVSIDGNLKGTTFTVNSGVAAGAKAVFTHWGLDVTNLQTYLFRHVNSDWLTSANRDKFTVSTPDNNRIRFAIDPNYGDDQQDSNSGSTPKPVKSGLFNCKGEAYTVDAETTSGSTIYCFENTFDENNMRQDRTTRVIFKATYTPAGDDFNTTNNPTGNWYTIGASATPLNEEQFVARINKAIADAGLSTTSTSPVTKEMVQTNLQSTDREITATALGFTGSDADTKTQKVRAVLGTIQVYKGGICYYIGRIRHFDDSEANWTTGTNGYDAASLGRYGIVRNNWYKITVKSVSQPGSPFIPQTTTDLDDVNNYYIDCDVNIEPWAVRSQGFDF